VGEHYEVERVLILDWFDGVVAALCVPASGDALLLEATSGLPLPELPEYRVRRVSRKRVRQLAAAVDELGVRDGRTYLPLWPTDVDAAGVLDAALERLMATLDPGPPGLARVNLGSTSTFEVQWSDEA
jgi:hypothetical protein